MHDVQLVGGRLRVTITQTPERVYMFLSGGRARRFEERKLRDFMWPLLWVFDRDPRPFEIDGNVAPGVGGVVRTLAPGVFAVEPLEVPARGAMS